VTRACVSAAGVGQIKGEAAKILLDEALGAQALLLGRRSYEFFAARWHSAHRLS
jgi:hypothetical protein